MAGISARNPTKQLLVAFHNAQCPNCCQSQNIIKTKWAQRAVRQKTLTNVHEVSVCLSGRMLVAKENIDN